MSERCDVCRNHVESDDLATVFDHDGIPREVCSACRANDEIARLTVALADAERQIAALSAALAASEQRRKPDTFGEDEYRVLWRMAEANLRQAAVENDRLQEALSAARPGAAGDGGAGA